MCFLSGGAYKSEHFVRFICPKAKISLCVLLAARFLVGNYRDRRYKAFFCGSIKGENICILIAYYADF
jgi:hypothetical protein